jgi:beta-galactosidase
MSQRAFLMALVAIVVAAFAALAAIRSDAQPHSENAAPAARPDEPALTPRQSGVAPPEQAPATAAPPSAPSLTGPVPPRNGDPAPTTSPAAPGTGGSAIQARPANEAVTRPDRTSMPREIVSLNDEWLFTKTNVLNAFRTDCEERNWSAVTLPHTWNAHDGQNGSPYFQGIGWYRRHVTIPESWAGRAVMVKLEGANQVATCFLNGRQIGEHRGGYAAFAFDISGFMVPGRDNILAVKVTNAPDPEIPPLRGDFTRCGGLYRGVSLVATDPLHISLLDCGSPGVYLTQRRLDDEVAEVDVAVKVCNDAADELGELARADVIDDQGRTVASCSQTIRVMARSALDWTGHLRIPHPHRWNGRADPYLYAIRVRLGADAVEQPLGLRTFSIDPDKGFLLNGVHLDLHGVALHQGHFNEGWAATDADIDEDIRLIRELGATMVRLAHYQHGQRTYDLLDRAGIIASSEIPWLQQSSENPPFAANCQQQLVEMIRQNYNHPAVICWSLFNQVESSPWEVSLARDLTAAAHREDPGRLVSGSSIAIDEAPVNHVTDIIAYNKYFGWYVPNWENFGPWADGFHRAHPQRCVGISEYGAGASVNMHDEHPHQPMIIADRSYHSEEYQALYHEVAWRQLASRPFLWCKIVWVMFDFASADRSDGELPGRNDKGLVTIDRKLRKDAYYFYQANWSDQPMVHIAGQHMVTRTSPSIDLRVYSNCDDVTVTINGQALPAVAPSGHVFLWHGAALSPGSNQVVATARTGGRTLTDHLAWSLSP